METPGTEPPYPGPERRRWPRMPAAERDARLFWDEGPGVRVCPARLADISRGGALLISPRAPAEGSTVRLGLTRARGVVRTYVVSAAPAADGGYEVRVSFVEPCPADFYQAAVRGIEASGPAATA